MRWLILLCVLTACGDPKGPGDPSVDSQTHWMQPCDTSAQCGELVCSCGVCTKACDDGCDGLESAVCGDACEVSVCLPTCGVFDDCAAFGTHLMCVAGQCRPGADDPRPDAGDAGDAGDGGDVGVDVPDGEADAGECVLEPALVPLVDAAGVDGSPRVGEDAFAWVDRALGRPHIAVARGAQTWRGVQPAGGVEDVAVAPRTYEIGVAWAEDGLRVMFDRLDTQTGLWAGARELVAIEEGVVGEVLVRGHEDGWSVAWTWDREECCPTLLRSVEMQALGADGAPVDAAVTLVAGDQLARQPAWTPTDTGFALVWVATSVNEVRAGTFGPTGAVETAAVAVSGPAAVPAEPSIAARGADLVVAWGDRRGNPARPEVYLARVGEAERQVTVDDKESRWPTVLAVDTGYALVWMDQVPARVPAGVNVARVGVDLTVALPAQVATMDGPGGGMAARWDGAGIQVGFQSVGPAGLGEGVLRPRRVRASADGVVLSAQSVLTGPETTPLAAAVATGATVTAVVWIDTRAGGADPVFAVAQDQVQLLPEVLLGSPGGVATGIDVAAAGDVFGVVYEEAGAVWFQRAGPAGPTAPALMLREPGAELAAGPVVAATADRFGVAWAEGDTVEFREISLGGQPLAQDASPYGPGGARIAIGAGPDGFTLGWTHSAASVRWVVGEDPVSFDHAQDAVPVAGGLLRIEPDRVIAELASGTTELPVELGDWVSVVGTDLQTVYGTRAAVSISPAGVELTGVWVEGFIPADVDSVAVGLGSAVSIGPVIVSCE